MGVLKLNPDRQHLIVACVARMRFGVWSVTKSVASAVAVLRLAQKYGGEVLDAEIKDYLKITAPAPCPTSPSGAR
jgi:CubicO group peptidase (beta-lactamase class C family)